jgi:WD40 repeat protein
LFTTGQTTQIYELNKFKPPVITVRSDLPVNSLAISPDGSRLALAAGKLIFSNFPRLEQTIGDLALQSVIDWVAYSPDGKVLVAVDRLSPQASVATLRDALTGQVLLSSRTFPYINSLAVAADGKSIAIGCNDGMVTLLDSATLQPRLTIPAHTGNVIRLFFTPDSHRLISHQQGDPSKCWDVSTGQKLFEFESELPGAFSPDGVLFATSDSQYNIHLREAATGQTRRMLHGHSGGVWAMVFSPDGKRLASAGDNAMIRIWDVELGTELLALKGHNKRITSLAFTPDGRTLVSAGRELSFRIWQTADPEETP